MAKIITMIRIINTPYSRGLRLVITIHSELAFTRYKYGSNDPTTNNRRKDIFSKGSD
ncbi:MAG TPA: hypothetical protein VHF44_01915 [Nitrososphaeraceae archaeon]|nr:hypothetical protein [Nitrososphaeraceae archaeon]